jgi:hypothetical protein
MKAVSKKREERTTEELVKKFNDMAGRFDSFWSGLSLSEREKFKEYLSQMRPPE